MFHGIAPLPHSAQTMRDDALQTAHAAGSLLHVPAPIATVSIACRTLIELLSAPGGAIAGLVSASVSCGRPEFRNH
jgi:hypothetical protein